MVFRNYNAENVEAIKAYYIPCVLKGVVSHALGNFLTNLLHLAKSCYTKTQFSMVVSLSYLLYENEGT